MTLRSPLDLAHYVCTYIGTFYANKKTEKWKQLSKMKMMSSDIIELGIFLCHYSSSLLLSPHPLINVLNLFVTHFFQISIVNFVQKHRHGLFRGIHFCQILSIAGCRMSESDLQWPMKRQNQSMITEFILIGFSNLGDLQILLFFIFLLVYLTTLMANATIMTVIRLDQTLHTPMYFFLFVLSCSETCYTLVIVPKMLANLLSTAPTISLSGCVAQLYFFVGLACTNCFLIAVMGYDRYVAICNPLNYTLIVSRATCTQLVLASSFCGFLISVVVNTLVFSVPFCASGRINHFFCSISPVIKLGCTDTNLKEMVSSFSAFWHCWFP